MGWNMRRKGSAGVLEISSSITAGSAAWARLVRTADGAVDLYINNWDGSGVASGAAILTLDPQFRPGWTRRLVSSSSTGYPYIGTDGVLRYNGTVGIVVISGLWVTPNPMP